MVKIRLVSCLSIAVALTAAVSCIESNTDAPTDRNVHPASWISPSASNNHGDAVLRNGSESCKVCHGLELDGTGAIPGCLDCHFDLLGGRVPDGSGWTHGSITHGQLLADEAICNKCHDIYRRYDLPPVGCHDCHGAGVSHPTGEPWLNKKSATFHGIDADRDLVQCAACHGADYTGGTSGVSCFLCHFSQTGGRVPDGETWKHGATPHDSLTPFSSVCNQCHQTNRDYDNAPSKCHDCHGAMASHPVGKAWLDKKSGTFHGVEAKKDPGQCADCHGADYRGGTSGVSCFRCHFTATGSKVPKGEPWTHGTTPHKSLASYVAVCNRCHEVNRTYGNKPSACHDCHGAVASHKTGSSWLLPSNHASESINDRASCLACHDLKTGGSGTKPACQSCHKQGDPPMSIGNCSSCHSPSPGTGEHKEHKDASCSTCHNGFGTGSLKHYYPSPEPPADVKLKFSDAGDDLTYNGARCSGTCHMDGDEKEHKGFDW